MRKCSKGLEVRPLVGCPLFLKGKAGKGFVAEQFGEAAERIAGIVGAVGIWFCCDLLRRCERVRQVEACFCERSRRCIVWTPGR